MKTKKIPFPDRTGGEDGVEFVRNIYIVLTDTGTVLSKIIRRYTGSRLNHVSIAFDEQLEEMYSFGRIQRHNPFSGGFVRERPGEGLLEDAECAVFRFRVTEEELHRIQARIREIERERDRYSYNFLGLIGIMLNREIPRKRAYFCSQFIVETLLAAGVRVTDTPAWRAQARDFSESKQLEPLYEGPLAGWAAPQPVRLADHPRSLRRRLLRVPFRRAAG
ncbi:hypothetical protein [Bhargavaea ullalensis]